MQLGIRLHDVAKLPFEERLKEARAQGFSCIHLALSKISDLPAGSEALTPGYAAWLKKTLDRYDMDAAVLGCYLNLANPDPEKLSSIQERYRAHLRFAALLGCGVVGTETGAPNLEYKYERACHTQEALDIFVEGLRPVVRDAERFGVRIAIEPVYKHIVWNGRAARYVLDQIASPNLRIIFDPVNLLHPDNIDRREEVLAEAMELLKDEIDVIHLKDYQIQTDPGTGERKMKAVACGLGEMDYSAVVDFAVRYKPYIHATMENTLPENAVAAREFIEGLEKKALENLN